MKKYILALTAICLLSAGIQAQHQTIEKDLKPFLRIIASPKINLILKKGDTESVQISYQGVSRDKINMEVSNKTLHLFLEGARKLEKQVSNGHRYHGIYDGASVTAYVTYKSLEGLEIRGEQELTCNDPIESPEFTLRAYGINEITLASLKTEYFKVSLYGENKLNIKDGRVIEQRYKLYGENDINTSGMRSAYISTSIFGEGDLSVHSAKEVRINAFGEPRIHVTGDGKINKRLILGRAIIRRR